MYGLTLQKYNRMAFTKFFWLLIDILGIPVTFLGIWLNIDNISSGVIAILSIAYLMIRGYYYIKQREQALREKDIELWHKEQDKQERIEKRNK